MMSPKLTLVKYEEKEFFFNMFHLILMSNKTIKTLSFFAFYLIHHFEFILRNVAFLFSDFTKMRVTLSFVDCNKCNNLLARHNCNNIVVVCERY